MIRRAARGFAIGALLGLTAGAVLWIAGGTASATPPGQDGEHKVGLCHRTASDENPYVFIEVDEAAIPAHLENGHGHPAKTNEDGTPRDDYLASSGEECDVPDPEPTPTATEPDPEPTPTATESDPPAKPEPTESGGSTSDPKPEPKPDVVKPEPAKAEPELPRTGGTAWLAALAAGLLGAGTALTRIGRRP